MSDSPNLNASEVCTVFLVDNWDTGGKVIKLKTLKENVAENSHLWSSNTLKSRGIYQNGGNNKKKCQGGGGRWK